MIKRRNSSPKPEEEYQDLGFGAKAANQSKRLINKDGSFNVEKRGMPFLESLSFYHSLISMSWIKFNLIILAGYIAVNLFFAALYMMTGLEHLHGLTGSTLADKFLQAFFFSGQTFTTVGYGIIYPEGFAANVVAFVESMAGLLGFAMATGLLYGRFSRPNAKIIFSRKAIVAPYKDITALEFRITNARKNQLIETSIQVILSLNESEGGKVSRKFHELKLERPAVTFFSLTWTIVHPIDETSPMYGMNYKDLVDSDAELLILLKGFDDTFSQTVHTRFSYKFDEIVWGARFENIFIDSDNEITVVDINKLHDYTNADLPGGS